MLNRMTNRLRIAVVAASAAVALSTYFVVTSRPSHLDARDIRVPRLADGVSVGIMSIEDRPALLNAWASWCLACRDEHDVLMSLSRQVPLYGLNHMDKPDDAQRWLTYFGDPYRWSMQDADGQLGRALGIKVLPATLLIGEDNEVLVRHEGPITMEEFRARFLPAIRDYKGDVP